ncbi:maleylpyruvate isomerase family mycothiol-dependent enzyme [soil metagenome]
MTLSHERYLDTIEKESVALAEAARENLDAHVPSCPEWNMSDLLGHMGEVQRFWNEMADRALTDPRASGDHDPPAGVDLIEWFTEAPQLLLGTLRDADLEQPMWSWSPVKKVGFVPRRMAQETAVHRWDAQNAVGNPSDIDEDLAVDGIDELLFVWLPTEAPLKDPPGSSVHIHTTDADGEWLAILDEQPVVTREHAKGDVALRGPASDVLLYLWGRMEPTSLEIHGDAAVLDHFRSVFDLE